jgi:hypothetical protein
MIENLAVDLNPPLGFVFAAVNLPKKRTLVVTSGECVMKNLKALLLLVPLNLALLCGSNAFGQRNAAPSVNPYHGLSLAYDGPTVDTYVETTGGYRTVVDYSIPYNTYIPHRAALPGGSTILVSFVTVHWFGGGAPQGHPPVFSKIPVEATATVHQGNYAEIALFSYPEDSAPQTQSTCKAVFRLSNLQLQLAYSNECFQATKPYNAKAGLGIDIEVTTLFK